MASIDPFSAKRPLFFRKETETLLKNAMPDFLTRRSAFSLEFNFTSRITRGCFTLQDGDNICPCNRGIFI